MKGNEYIMRKTKIICTLGPAVDEEEKLKELIKSGMNVARFNFSHGDYEEQESRIELFKVFTIRIRPAHSRKRP